MCKICKETSSLKDGICPKCEKKQPELPDSLKDLFKYFDGDRANE